MRSAFGVIHKAEDEPKGAKGRIYRLAEKIEDEVEGKEECDCSMCKEKKISCDKCPKCSDVAKAWNPFGALRNSRAIKQGGQMRSPAELRIRMGQRRQARTRQQAVNAMRPPQPAPSPVAPASSPQVPSFQPAVPPKAKPAGPKKAKSGPKGKKPSNKKNEDVKAGLSGLPGYKFMTTNSWQRNATLGGAAVGGTALGGYGIGRSRNRG